jgi:hypothetical protein
VDQRLLLDTDALIKLNRAGILDVVLNKTECAIHRAVFEEAVTNAKARGKLDAEAIEAALAGRCEVMDVAVPERLGLGRGEAGLLALAETGRGGLLVSDDERFQAILRSRQMAFINCAGLVARLAEERILTVDDASITLYALRPYISSASFEFADLVLRSMSGDGNEED